jgi:hypothetical protein
MRELSIEWEMLRKGERELREMSGPHERSTHLGLTLF